MILLFNIQVEWQGLSAQSPPTQKKKKEANNSV